MRVLAMQKMQQVLVIAVGTHRFDGAYLGINLVLIAKNINLFVSPQQVAVFAKIYPMNARPIQPTNGREILQSK